MARLKINFIFPFRWLKEDRKFLKQNLERMIPGSRHQNPSHPILMQDQPQVVNYMVRFKQHSFQPKVYKMDKETINEVLKDVFPGATCTYFEKFFVQKNQDAGLPVMEMEIYY